MGENMKLLQPFKDWWALPPKKRLQIFCLNFGYAIFTVVLMEFTVRLPPTPWKLLAIVVVVGFSWCLLLLVGAWGRRIAPSMGGEPPKSASTTEKVIDDIYKR